MKKSRFFLFFLFFAFLFLYYLTNPGKFQDNLSSVEHFVNTKIFDPGKYVLNENVPNDELIEKFHSDLLDEDFYLYAGSEEKYGLRHILARHTNNYFINFENKDYNDLFPPKTNGFDIIYGIKSFLNNCIEDKEEEFILHNKKNRVFLGIAPMDEKEILSVLVVREYDNSIITFYPLNKSKEQILSDSLKNLIKLRVKQKVDSILREDYYIY